MPAWSSLVITSWTRFRVGCGLQERIGEVRLERLPDEVRLVDEVHDLGGVLVLAHTGGGDVGAVEPGQGLHRGDPGEQAVDVHRAQQRLVEAGLELVGTIMTLNSSPLKALRRS